MHPYVELLNAPEEVGLHVPLTTSPRTFLIDKATDNTRCGGRHTC